VIDATNSSEVTFPSLLASAGSQKVVHMDRNLVRRSSCVGEPASSPRSFAKFTAICSKSSFPTNPDVSQSSTRWWILSFA
jgi:hypothetical protein